MTRLPSLETLRVFEVACRHGSYSEAARELHVTHSAVSQRIRQLEEELVDFWYNHFNVFLDKGADRFMVPTYEREAIRPYVLGHFRALLEATASSPAMLFYLDNWQSVAPDTLRRPAGNRPQRGLNENYARELMELHTLGVDGGYTQKDIIEVARCFTGWTIKNPQQLITMVKERSSRSHSDAERDVLGWATGKQF